MLKKAAQICEAKFGVLFTVTKERRFRLLPWCAASICMRSDVGTPSSARCRKPPSDVW